MEPGGSVKHSQGHGSGGALQFQQVNILTPSLMEPGGSVKYWQGHDSRVALNILCTHNKLSK